MSEQELEGEGGQEESPVEKAVPGEVEIGLLRLLAFLLLVPAAMVGIRVFYESGFAAGGGILLASAVVCALLQVVATIAENIRAIRQTIQPKAGGNR